MKTTKWILLTVLSTIGLLVTTFDGSLMAQAPAGQPAGSTGTASDSSGYIELSRSAIQNDRQAIVLEVMDLTEQEGKGFWPLYREYRTEVQKVNDQLVQLISDYAKTYENLSDAQAQQMLNNFLAYQREKLDLQTEYAKRFSGILPAKKVARYFQLESKMDAVLNYNLAGIIPLVN